MLGRLLERFNRLVYVAAEQAWRIQVFAAMATRSQPIWSAQSTISVEASRSRLSPRLPSHSFSTESH